jgi:drug/metabolite transporter (DMT)-like permease
VTPLVSTSPAITTVLALVILGERPGRPAVMGIALVLIGIAVLSRSAVLAGGAPPKNARAGLASAFVALVGFGVLAFALKYTVGAIGPMTTIVTLRLVGVMVLLVTTGAQLTRFVRPVRNLWTVVGAVVLLDTAGFVAYTSGIRSGSVAIVATLSGLFSAVTVGLAILVLKERLTPAGYVSIAVMLLGVALIARG